MDILDIIASENNLKMENLKAAVELFDSGSTVPFIARYRKEVTGGLTDELLQTIETRLSYLRGLKARQETILKSIEEQGKLTEDLKKKIDEVVTLASLEDIYRPFKPKRLTRGEKAKKAGLYPLYEHYIATEVADMEAVALKYLNEEAGILTIKDAISGASDIMAEIISDNPNYRTYIKGVALKCSRLKASKIANVDNKTYDTYANYEELVSHIKAHRTLAINRGVKEKVLNRSIIFPESEIIEHIAFFEIRKNSPYKEELHKVIEDSFERLIKPSVELDIFNDLFEAAEDSSITIFRKNLYQLLMAAPFDNEVILGFDPGFRTGCKIAIIDTNGTVLGTDIIHCTLGASQAEREIPHFQKLLKDYHVTLIALGNGTATRESEDFINKCLIDFPNVKYEIVSEAGASVYSASPLAQKEFPEFDVSLRSAVSLARRLLDPLTELVKISPLAMGVGQYQHDMNEKKLSEALTGVVENAVNEVGVDLNRASPSLLSYISGLSPKLTESIVNYRVTNGEFKTRQELKKVKGFGPKAFENAAGFLRINGVEPLDNSAIHPESYDVCKKLLKFLKVKNNTEVAEATKDMTEDEFIKLAEYLKVGLPTLRDILRELDKPGRDPRSKVNQVKHDNNIKSIEDLKVGMILEGVVRNICDFGAFVDLGLHIDGLVHISQLSDHRVNEVSDVLSIGEQVKVRVLEANLQKQQIKLSMKSL